MVLSQVTFDVNTFHGKTCQNFQKKLLKKLVKSLLAQHKSQQDWSFERVPTCKLSNVKVVCLQRAGAKNARYSAQLSAPHRSKSKFPPKTKFRKKNSGNCNRLTNFENKANKIIGNLQTVVLNCAFFSEKSENWIKCIIFRRILDIWSHCAPCLQHRHTLLSLGRQIFCLEVGRGIFYRFVRFIFYESNSLILLAKLFLK